MTTALNTMKRRNAMHVIAWCMTAVVAVVVLAQLRHYGQAAIMRYNGRNTLVSAWDGYVGGNIVNAQQSISRLARVQPHFEKQIVDRFGQHLLAMPALLQQLFPPDVTSDGENSDVALTGMVLTGDADGAASRIDTLIQEDQISGDLLLWRGRQALRAGDIRAAKSAYGRYWEQNTKARVTAGEQAVATGTSLEERVNALLWWGLWDEAFALSQSVPEARAEPMAKLCEGIAAELAGDRPAADQAYAEVLATRPGNHLARMRAQALQER